MWALVGAFLAVLCRVGSTQQSSPEVFSLNGNQWSVRNAVGNVTKIPAMVPGQIHMDLYNDGKIGNPYYRFNDTEQQWVALQTWIYSRPFDMSNHSIDYKSVWLKCDGIDTVANITINDDIVGRTSDQHRQYYFDILDSITEGPNTLEISFESVALYSERKSEEYPYKVGGGGSYFPIGNKNFIRKAQSDFGWDWGPAFLPVGIWRDISIVLFEVALALVTDVVPQVYLHDKNNFIVSTLICAQLTTDDPVTLDVSIKVGPLGKTDQKFTVQGMSEQCVRADMMVPTNHSKLQLWYPIGYGKPNLYQFEATINAYKNNASSSVVTIDKMIGFRHLELVQEPFPSGEEGLSFYFRINGVPVFAKGSNWIPVDAFESRVTNATLEWLLQSAVASHQNMLRVWGGGIYQRDEFYDLCDQLGVMVWQEFMFAVGLYPRDKDFLSNVTEEVKHQVRRLGHHSSIVLWSGNNENQNIALHSDTQHVLDYDVLYDGTVRPALMAEDKSRPYWPSSPSNGYLFIDDDRGLVIQRWGDSQDPHYGDVHRYDYTDLCTNVTKFPRPRFASEFGFQSYPSFETMKEISIAEDWDNNSTLMNHRQHHPDGNDQLAKQLERFFHLPDNKNKSENFSDFIYLTQVVQAICIQAEAEHYRRIKNESNGYTMGTLYWQLNDIWQAQSWASIEYNGRWKLLHNAAKKFYAPLLVSPFQQDKNVTVYVVSDDNVNSYNTLVSITLLQWSDGTVVRNYTVKVPLKPLQSGQVWSLPMSQCFQTCSTTDCFLVIKMYDMDNNMMELASNAFYPVSFSQVKLPMVEITVTGVNQVSATSASIALESSAVAIFVRLSTELVGYFSDNGFLMLPKEKVSVTFTSPEKFDVKTLKSSLTIRSVRDTY
ncbi:beta-mannosidase-like [Dysidea avara]|uniref:beta-mannosidase-like n=1 Tax=Dysidea avara TaxID=196820 RepID=UPI003320E1E2